MPDACFDEPRLAALYDPLDPDRSDLDAYVAMVSEFGARSVLDVGCGTGTFACRLALMGVDVIGVDPAAASLDVARDKPGADRVRWVHGVVADLPPLRLDLATMTANVAQAIVSETDWMSTLRGIYASLRPDGRLVFETRVPARRAWREWTRERSLVRADIPDVGPVTAWVDVTDVSGDLVSFRWTYVFASDGGVLTSDSTLRFRSRSDIAESLAAAGFELDDVRDAPDRPGHELVFVARRPA